MYLLRTLTAKAVVKVQTQFISVFGIPQVIQSDHGTNLSSQLFETAQGKTIRLLDIMSRVKGTRTEPGLGREVAMVAVGSQRGCAGKHWFQSE